MATETVLVIDDSEVNVSGVANLGLFADDGADVIIKNSKMHSDGGTLYADYKNSPDQSTMVAPPWVLGIMGTSRGTNLMGNNSSTTVIDSEVSAAQWAVLSTDSGTNMKLNVVNTTMLLTGADYVMQNDDTFGDKAGKDSNPYTTRSGYGTYAIGNADRVFLRCRHDGGHLRHYLHRRLRHLHCDEEGRGDLPVRRQRKGIGDLYPH